MKFKTLKWILIGCIVAILCIVAFFIIQFIPKPAGNTEKDDGVSQSYEREGISVYTVSESLLQAVEVWNQNDSYRVLKDSTGNAYIEGEEGIPLLVASIKALYESVLNIRIESNIAQDVQDLSDYGLVEPQAILTVKKVSGEDDIFYLGDKTPDGMAYYFKKSDNGKIYAVSTYFAERLLKTRVDYYSTAITYIFEETGFVDLSIQYPDTARNIFIRMCTQEELDSKLYESTMLMTSPFLSGANTDAVREHVSDFRTLSAIRIVSAHPSVQDIEQYGLHNPVVLQISVDIDKSKAVIDNVTNVFYDASAKSGEMERVVLKYRIGKTENNEQYIMFGDTNVIYAVEKGQFDFVEQSTDYFCQRLVTIKYLKDLDYFTIQRGNESYKINVSTQTNTDKTIYNGFYQGRNIDGPSMQILYRQIIGLSNYGLSDDPGKDVMMVITLHGLDGSQMVLEFIPTSEDELYAFARIDGFGRFKVLTSKLDLIWANTKTLISGGKLADIY